jgi:protein-tyrosine phosphatase
MDLYWITPALAVSTRPRGGDWLDDEITSLRSEGVDVLVSCLTDEEERDLDLAEERTAATAGGLTFVRAPIADRSIPQSDVMNEAVRSIEQALVSGRRVAVHCRQGLGRAPMVAAATLVATGMDADDAWEAVARGRGQPVPETEEQRDWLDSFAIRRALSDSF